MSPDRISLGQHRGRALRRRAAAHALRRPESVRDYDLARLLAALETPRWLANNAETVKAAHRALAAPEERP